jgi:hypothetical protein
MGTSIRVDIQLTGISSLGPLLELTDPKLFAKALKGGISYAAKAGATQAGKSVSSRYNIKSSRVKADIRGPYIRGDEASIYFSRRPPSAIQYGGRDNGKGLSISVFKGQRVNVARGFIMQPGPKAGPKAGKPWQRISPARNAKLRFVYGPSLGAIAFGTGRHATAIKAELATRMNEQFIKGVQRVLDSASRGYGN